jgi:hypothetical protein
VIPTSTRLTSLVLVLGVAVAAGAAGVLAGVDSAVRTALVLVFLAVAPTVAIAGLLRTLDGFARLVIACTATIVILALTAIIMLAGGVWSPTGGLLAVAAITAACLVAQVPAVRRGVAAQAASGRAAARYLAARAGRGAAPDEPSSEFPATSALAAAGYGTTGPVGGEDDGHPVAAEEATSQAGPSLTRPGRR